MSGAGDFILPRAVAATDFALKRWVIPPDAQVDVTTFKSYLGTPVYDPLLFLSSPPVTGIVAGQITTGQSTVILRVDSCLIEVNMEKVIQKTQIMGRVGTIKEYISLGDYEINIEGAIFSDYPNYYPVDDVQTLVNICQQPTQIKVASSFLQLMGITNLVIRRYKIGQKLGSRNEVPFSIVADSDFTDEEADNSQLNTI